MVINNRFVLYWGTCSKATVAPGQSEFTVTKPISCTTRQAFGQNKKRERTLCMIVASTNTTFNFGIYSIAEGNYSNCQFRYFGIGNI